jgi:hypothetical protein
MILRHKTVAKIICISCGKLIDIASGEIQSNKIFSVIKNKIMKGNLTSTFLVVK